MQYIYTKIVLDMVSNTILNTEGFWYDGPIERACGASKQQGQIEQTQQSYYNTLINQAQTEFGNASQIFNDLTSSFEPILAQGPNQNGYSEAELANLNSQAITQTGQAYRNAAQAAGERTAAAGGGSQVLPSGAAAGINANIATAGAAQTASQLADIRNTSAALGRQNWLAAAGVLGGAPGVFGTSTGASNAATSGGNAAANTANQISQANSSWENLVGGVLGGVASGVTGGLMGGIGGGSTPAFGGMSPTSISGSFGGPTSVPTIPSSLPDVITG
jgi:hypothetical protein